VNFYVFTYDIPDDKRRTKVASILEDYGHRVQFSVFELWLEAAHERELRRRLMEVLDDSADSVRFYRLCGTCQHKVEIVGMGKPPEPPGAIIL
jgi:CRISPR-associated protein Cas2